MKLGDQTNYFVHLPSAKNGDRAKSRSKNNKAMKENLHPSNYRVCAFKDMGTGDVTLIRSCANARDTFEVDGVAYPLVKMEVSSYSHPFYTGKQKLLDTAGRVDKFRNRYAKFTK